MQRFRTQLDLPALPGHRYLRHGAMHFDQRRRPQPLPRRLQALRRQMQAPLAARFLRYALDAARDGIALPCRQYSLQQRVRFEIGNEKGESSSGRQQGQAPTPSENEEKDEKTEGRPPWRQTGKELENQDARFQSQRHGQETRPGFGPSSETR